MRAFIVDDEQLCIDTLTHHLKGIEAIEIIGQASTVNEAISAISAQKPELVFLDVELPDGTGFDVLKAFPNPSFRIIFITAYDRFAISALRCSAVDYLLKPIDPTELKAAIGKVTDLNADDSKVSFEALIANIKKSEERRLVVRTSDDIFLVPISEITHLESDGAYTHIFRIGRKRITVSHHLKHFEEMLMEQSFFRSHQSHLVNIRYIDGFKKNDGGYIVLKDGTSIPVSHRKRDALFALFEKLA